MRRVRRVRRVRAARAASTMGCWAYLLIVAVVGGAIFLIVRLVR